MKFNWKSNKSYFLTPICYFLFSNIEEKLGEQEIRWSF